MKISFSILNHFLCDLTVNSECPQVKIIPLQILSNLNLDPYFKGILCRRCLDLRCWDCHDPSCHEIVTHVWRRLQDVTTMRYWRRVTPTGIQTIAIFHDQISSGKTDTPRCNSILEEDPSSDKGHAYLSGGENVNISTSQTSLDNNTMQLTLNYAQTIHNYRLTDSVLINAGIELEMISCYPRDRCRLWSYFRVAGEQQRSKSRRVFMKYQTHSYHMRYFTGLLTLSTNTFIRILWDMKGLEWPECKWAIVLGLLLVGNLLIDILLSENKIIRLIKLLHP